MGLVFTVFLPLLAVVLILAYRDRKRLLPLGASTVFRFIRENWFLSIPYFLLIYAKFILDFLGENVEHLLTYVTARSVFHLLECIGYKMMPLPDPYILKTQFFTTKVLSACSGFDGITFFVAAFSCLLIVEGKGYSKKTIFMTYFAGIFYMLSLNILRVLAIVVFGNWATSRWGAEKGMELFIGPFHRHLGWVSDILATAVFFWVFFKFSKKTAPR